MDLPQFVKLLESVSEADWQRVIAGNPLVLTEDRELVCGKPGDIHACVDDGGFGDAGALRTSCLQNAKTLYDDYYRTHALTREGFKRLALALVEEHGAAQFAGHFGVIPARTLFVDGGSLIAADATNPRHRYGAYCEIEGKPSTNDISRQVLHWIESGEAYANYLGMNACRYNC